MTPAALLILYKQYYRQFRHLKREILDRYISFKHQTYRCIMIYNIQKVQYMLLLVSIYSTVLVPCFLCCIRSSCVFFRRSSCNPRGGRWCGQSVDKALCYSPTCTPAQLSLLSDAIAKYSAFAASRSASSPAADILR